MRSDRITSIGIARVSPIYQTSSELPYNSRPKHDKYLTKKKTSNNRTEDSELVQTADGHISVWA